MNADTHCSMCNVPFSLVPPWKPTHQRGWRGEWLPCPKPIWFCGNCNWEVRPVKWAAQSAAAGA